jgi:hypothetical protein
LSEPIVAIASPSAESSFIENQDSLHSPLGFIMTLGMVAIAAAVVGALIYVVI